MKTLIRIVASCVLVLLGLSLVWYAMLTGAAVPAFIGGASIAVASIIMRKRDIYPPRTSPVESRAEPVTFEGVEVPEPGRPLWLQDNFGDMLKAYHQKHNGTGKEKVS